MGRLGMARLGMLTPGWMRTGHFLPRRLACKRGQRSHRRRQTATVITKAATSAVIDLRLPDYPAGPPRPRRRWTHHGHGQVARAPLVSAGSKFRWPVLAFSSRPAGY